MIKPIPTLVIAIFAITTFTMSTPAHANGFLDKLFGKSQDEQKGPPPEVTLQAPFPTTPDTKPEGQSKLMDIYGSNSNPLEDVNDLSKQHRNEKQIVEWATETVTQAMTINLKTHDNDFKKVGSLFTPYAMKEYQDYLQKMNMSGILSSNNMRLQSISDEEGSVIKDGAIGDTYHWLVQIPLLSSFYPEAQHIVDKTTKTQSQNLLVQVQVGRVATKSSNDIGLVIERWSVSSQSKK